MQVIKTIHGDAKWRRARDITGVTVWTLTADLVMLAMVRMDVEKRCSAVVRVAGQNDIFLVGADVKPGKARKLCEYALIENGIIDVLAYVK